MLIMNTVLLQSELQHLEDIKNPNITDTHGYEQSAYESQQW